MPCSRTTKRGSAIARNQRQTSRERFITELHNCLPRQPLGNETAWEANGKAIACLREADRWLRAGGDPDKVADR